MDDVYQINELQDEVDRLTEKIEMLEKEGYKQAGLIDRMAILLEDTLPLLRGNMDSYLRHRITRTLIACDRLEDDGQDCR